MKVRWRFIGSSIRWFWLARIIRGSSQQVRTRRGVEIGSEAIKQFRKDQPISAGSASQSRLVLAITRL